MLMLQLFADCALDGPDDSIHEMMEKFTARRKLIHEGLNDLPGVEVATWRCFLCFS